MTAPSTLEFRVQGMDCPQCAIHVCHAIEALDGVSYADVRLTAGKAVVELDADRVSVDHIRAAVAAVGYTVPAGEGEPDDAHLERSATAFAKRAALFMGMVFGAVLLVVVAGEWLGLFERATDESLEHQIGAPVLQLASRKDLDRAGMSQRAQKLGVAHDLARPIQILLDALAAQDFEGDATWSPLGIVDRAAAPLAEYR